MTVGSVFFGNQIQQTKMKIDRALERVATGSRLNSARDGGSELARAFGIENDVTGLNAGNENINSSRSILDQAGSSLESIRDQLLKLKEIAIKASSESPLQGASEPPLIEPAEVEGEISVQGQIVTSNLTSNEALFNQGLENVKVASLAKADNGKNLFDGKFESEFIAGTNSSDLRRIKLDEVSLDSLGLQGININTSNDAQEAAKRIDQALSQIDSSLAKVSAQDSSLDFAEKANSDRIENLTSSLERLTANDLISDSEDLVRLESLLSNQQSSFERFLEINRNKDAVFAALIAGRF